MENRLLKVPHFLLIFAGLLTLSVSLHAQVDMTFEYTGPDTIYVGADCTAPLNWGHPATTSVVCNTPDCIITDFFLMEISGGYAINDPVEAGVTVFITYQADYDINGEVGSLHFIFEIDFVDDTDPVFDAGTLPANATYDCLAQVPGPPTLTATDNCPPPGGGSSGVTVVYNGQTTTPPGCDGGSFDRNWTATDDAGNSTTYIQTITLLGDSDDPVITGTPVGATESCEMADYGTWITAQRAIFNATDSGCGLMGLSDDAPAVYDEDCSSLDVTFTATDLCGNTAAVTVTYTITDNINPIISPPAVTDTTLQCTGVPSDPITQILNWSDNFMVADNCTTPGDIVWSNDFTGLAGGCGGTTGTASVTYTATDQCGNADAVTINFTVQDSNDPDIIAGAKDTTVVCDGNGNQVQLSAWLADRADSEASDVCTADADIAMSMIMSGNVVTPAQVQDSVDAQLASGCGASVTVEFAYTDLCGNTSTTDADFNIIDTIAPALATFAQNITVECDNPSITYSDWLNTRGGASAVDVCTTIDNGPGSTHWSYTLLDSIPGTCYNESRRIVLFTVTDGCGHTATSSAQYIVEDNISPTISPTASDHIESCGGGDDQSDFNAWVDNYGGATAFDNCSDVEWDFFSYTISSGGSDTGIEFGDYASYPAITPVGCDWSIEVIFTVIDSCNNPSTTMATFFATDMADPTFSGIDPSNATLTVNCDDPIPALPNVVATDNCDASVTVALDSVDTPLSCLYHFQRTRTWTATDDCNNTAVVTQTIIVQDVTPPTLSGLPGNATVDCNNVPTAPVLGTDYTAADNCDGNISAGVQFDESSTQGTDPDNCNFYNYTLTRTWTVTDVCGNANTYTQDIMVQDVGIPSFTAPADTLVDCHIDLTPGGTGTVANVSDNCDADPMISYDDVIVNIPGACPNNYIIERTWTVADACNNAAATQLQTITVQDTIGPTITSPAETINLECTTETAADAAFANWVNNNGNATAFDLCTTNLNWFAAVPGSYNINDQSTWPGTHPGALDPAVCPSPNPGIYRSETVDFVVYDDCNAATSTTGVFNVIDTSPPDFVFCPGDDAVATDPGQCYNLYTLAAPIIADGCNNEVSYNFTESQPIASSQPGDDDTPVNPVTITFSGLPTPPVIATGTVALQLDFTMLDGEEPTEFFNIYGDDGSFLGTTNFAPAQCTDVTTVVNIPAATFNAWAIDGQVQITLEPNIPANQPGIFAINDICPNNAGTGGGTSVDASLDYSANEPNNLTFQYGINNGPLQTVDPIAPVVDTLMTGANTITYYATDCVGNVGTCSFVVDVTDNQDPTISCPSDIVYNLAADEGCGEVDIALDIPTSVMDNCPFLINSQTQPTSNSAALLTFTYNPNYLEYMADDKDFTFVGTAANAVGDFATFTVTIRGDADGVEEYFTIYDEDGNVLGTTEVGQPNVTVTPANCPAPGMTVAVFQVPVALFNTWAADGTVDVSAVSNIVFSDPPPGGPDDGINPSCTTFPNGTPDGETDGTSWIFVELEYQYTDIFYYTTGATETPLTQMLPPALSPTINFELGDTEVFYTISDNSGNEAACSFTVSVNDVLPPIVDCDATTIFVNPSGNDDYELDWWEIEDGSDSFDENCDIESYDVSPNIFSCEMVDQVVVVTLTATDQSGNSSSCTSLVSIETEQPEPEYSVGICGDDNLYLFANAPNAPGEVIFTFTWYDPNGNIISTEEDPVIPGVDENDSGAYVVEIEGLTGCTSIGVVNVVINAMPDVPEFTVSANNACVNEDLILTTQSVSGTDVEYIWYSGFPPNGTVLGTTDIPQFTIFAPLPTGSDSYYVVVEVDGCTSSPSLFQTVDVSDAPVAMTNDPVINICEGEDVVLGTSVMGQNYEYQWTGPNGFNYTTQFPPVISSADLNDAGTYNLVISLNGCESNVATTEVNITATPPMPIISTAGVACLGDDLVLTANVSGGDSYTWIAPDFSEIVTIDNELNLTNVTEAQSGNWSVFVTSDGCSSPASNPVNVFIEPVLTLAASNDGPICEGNEVQLSVNSIPGATYEWTGPGGFNSLAQNPVADAVGGIYTVLVTTSTGCSNTAATTVVVGEAPTITALSNTGAACVTGADDIVLVPTVFPPDDGTYTYLWTFPNGGISTDSMPVLPNGTSQDNGSYVLVVTNGDGCSSQPATTVVNVSDAPTTPVMDAPAGQCEGSTLTLTTTGYIGTVVTYTWMTPVGSVMTNVPSLTVDNVSAASSGNYTVVVTVDGCTSNPSATATILIGPVPDTPVITSNSPICEGQTIELFTDLIPNAEYQWVGPGNFDAVIHNPVVFNANEDNAGAYQVQVIIDGCPSEFSVPVNIEVNDGPSAAVTLNDGPVCIDDPGAALLLSVSAGSAVPGATYTWYDAQTNEVVAGPTSSLNASVVDFSNYGEGLFDFYVITELDGCFSVNSIPTTVEMNTTPTNGAFAGNDVTVCGSQTVSLEATPPTVGTGVWVQLSGPAVVIVNPNSATSPLSGLMSGNSYTFLWTLSNGACMDYSSDEVVITVDDDTEIAQAGPDLELCNQDTAVMQATTPGAGVTGMWIQTPAQQAMGVVVLDPSDPNTTIVGLQPGNAYSFIWVLSNACGEFDADEVIVEIEESAVIADAEDDFSICGNGTIEIFAAPNATGVGVWTTSSDAVIVSPNSNTTEVSGLTSGVYTFVWTLDNGACGITVDSVTVDYESAPDAMPDILDVPFAGQGTINVAANDIVAGDYTIVINSTPNSGTIQDLGNGDIEYTASMAFVGSDLFTYSICSDVCPDDCGTATVTVVVGENAECITPTIFTPNNDGVNDEFIIPCLATDRFPENVVSIFNQWGDEVFRASPYGNNWRGTYNGADLPVGTYFYVIDFGEGEAAQSGFVVLER